MTATGNTTVGDVVAGDFRAAAVFQQFGIDFCCGGGKTIDEACEARNLRTTSVLQELERACASNDSSVPRFDDWDADVLAKYIVDRHHAYVRQALPAITLHLEKLARVHGGRHPELHEIARRFESVVAEMTSHMAK